MDMRLIERICEFMEDKDTEELLKIYSEHDMEKWSEEAFEAINLILKKRGEHTPQITGEKSSKEIADEPGMKEIDLKEVVKGIERSERGGCLKVFLLLTGIAMFLRGGYNLIFGSREFWVILVDLILMGFGIGIVYAGVNLKKVVVKYPKVIYTLVITNVVGTLMHLGYKFEYVLTQSDILSYLINIVVAWIILDMAIKLRMDWMEPRDEKKEKKGIITLRSSNVCFSILIAIILLLGIVRIGIFAPSSIERAYGFLNEGKVIEALDAFKTVIKREPDNKNAYFGVGLCYVGMKKFDQAIECFDLLIAKFHKDLDIYFKVVYVVNHIMEKYNTAIKILNRAKEVKTRNKIEALFFEREYQENMGWAYYKMGKMKKAMACFKKARPLWDNYLKLDLGQKWMAEIYLYYGVYYKLIGEKKRAIYCFKISVKHAISPIFEKKGEEELQKIKEEKSQVLKI